MNGGKVTLVWKGDEVVAWLTNLFNNILKSKKMSDEGRKTNISSNI